MFNDVVHDMRRRVVDPARFLDFRFFLDHCSMPLGEADHFPQKLLVDLAENIGRENRELVRAVGII